MMQEQIYFVNHIFDILHHKKNGPMAGLQLSRTSLSRFASQCGVKCDENYNVCYKDSNIVENKDLK
jgi:hypothetical protein